MSARVQAFLCHLVGSAIIAVLAMLLVFRVWYPAPLHEALGVAYIFLLLLSVDVVVGPFLTLLVFKVGKKSLVFDLAVIALLQSAALGYGLWTVAEGRPAWLVFNVDRFDLVQVVDLDTRKLDEALEEYRQPSWLGPRWVAAVPAKDIKVNNEIKFEAVLLGLDLSQRPNLYVPLESQHDVLQKRMLMLSELSKFNNAEQVSEVLQQWPEANAWLPLAARTRSMVVLLRRETAEVIAVVDLNPWAS